MELAQGGNGVLEEIGRGIIPPEVIDRPRGCFPVPAITHLAGKALDLVRDALSGEAARERRLFRPLALQHCPDVLVEELVPGDDLRVVVIDHEGGGGRRPPTGRGRR